TLMLVVNPSVPARTVKELIEYGKANPGKLSFASANTSGIVAGETLRHWAELDMLHVPYKSSPPAIQDVLAGRVSMMFTDLTTGLPHVRSGALRALAVTRLQRSPLFPELPTLDEAGVTGFDMDSWAGIVAPAQTPPAIVTQLNRELRKIIDDPDVKSKLGNVGFEAFSSSPKEFEGFVKVQLGKWGKMVRDAGIQPDGEQGTVGLAAWSRAGRPKGGESAVAHVNGNSAAVFDVRLKVIRCQLDVLAWFRGRVSTKQDALTLLRQCSNIRQPLHRLR